MSEFLPIQELKKDCFMDGECFAKDKFGRCKILLDTPLENCSFQKTKEEYAEGIRIYGNGKEYAKKRALKDYDDYRKEKGL